MYLNFTWPNYLSVCHLATPESLHHTCAVYPFEWIQCFFPPKQAGMQQQQQQLRFRMKLSVNQVHVSVIKRSHAVLTCVGAALAVPVRTDRPREHKHSRASEASAGPIFSSLITLLWLQQHSSLWVCVSLSFTPLSLLTPVLPSQRSQ